MPYLVCDRCGHPNPAQSPSLTFCGGCGHKLARSFSVWQQRHPEQSLADFWRSECIAELPVMEQRRPASWANPMVVALVLAAAMSMLGAAAWFLIGHGAKRITGLNPNEIRFISTDTSRWQRFGGAEGRFGVYMPMGQPQRSLTTTSTGIGPVDMVMYTLELSPKHHPNLLYSVAFAEYPRSFMEQYAALDRNVDVLFDEAAQSLVQGAQAQLVAAYHSPLGSHPGRAVLAEMGGGVATIEARFYLVHSTMYCLQVVAPAEQHPNPAADFFFGSFEPLSHALR